MLLRSITKLLNYVHTFRTASNNHYQTLGIARTATIAEIKKKYYELAKIYHPDVCKDTDSNIKFNNINIAYQILTDQAKRSQYDFNNPTYNSQQNHKANKSKQNQFNGFTARYRSHKQRQAKNQQDEDPFMAYDQYFKNNKSYAKPKRGTDVNINLTISLEESILGVKKQVKYTQAQVCQACSNIQKQICFACGGKRTIFNRVKRQKQQCSSCQGKGFINQCQTCYGSSNVTKDVSHHIYVPKNTHNKTILRLEGLGNHGYRSLNGDLYVTVIVQESNQYKIDGNNVHSEFQLDYITAILGGKIKVKTIYGLQQVQVEPGTQSGKQLRIFNLGLTSQYSKRKGDHIVLFKIKVPINLTAKQKQLLSELNL